MEHEDAPPEAADPPPVTESGHRTLSLSNLDKVFWPEEGYTKGDLIAYHEAIAPWILPYLQDRLLVLTRYPDGIAGKNFFQKNAPPFIPSWLRTETRWSEHAEREIEYFICDDLESLLYVINLASIPLHVWASRVATLQRPDWTVLDLDPKSAPFSDVVEIARAAHELCEEIGLPSFVKTTGSTGIHVLIPLGGQCTYEQARTLAQVLARVLVDRMPEIATVERVMQKRKGRVYIDFVQNGHGRTIVAPFSVRPVPGALVSTPLDWSEVDEHLDMRDFDIRTVPDRMRARGADPMRPVLDLRPDLPAALAALASRVR